MRRVKTTLFLWAALLVLALPAAAQAHNDGRGFYGVTNDKVVTNAGFIVIAFFPLFILFMSLLQKRLEKRKEARVAHKADLANGRWRGGW